MTIEPFSKMTRLSLQAEFKRHELGLSIVEVADKALVSEPTARDFFMCREGIKESTAQKILKVLGME